jgi:hypothetical protein
VASQGLTPGCWPCRESRQDTDRLLPLLLLLSADTALLLLLLLLLCAVTETGPWLVAVWAWF